MGYSAEEFSRLALESRAPVDLGSRCTVFMNSRVKQAQKEGATPADIAAGLAYSVIKNALQKVIRIRNPKQLGAMVVAQGGDLLERGRSYGPFELISGRDAIRPVESGLMGAYGAALIAKSRAKRPRSALLGPKELSSFSATSESARCKGCGNACLLTITSFEGSASKVYVTGNRCERGAALIETARGIAHREGTRNEAAGIETPPDLYAWKYERLFRYVPLEPDKAPRGRIGIPRVLNLYENYPFWFTLFTALGFRVELSPRLLEGGLRKRGWSPFPRNPPAYPAKLVHGHIERPP